MTQVFTLIQLLLKLFGVWEQFQNWSDAKRMAEAEERNQNRKKAVDEQKNAQTEKEFDEAQRKIVDNLPRP